MAYRALVEIYRALFMSSRALLMAHRAHMRWHAYLIWRHAGLFCWHTALFSWHIGGCLHDIHNANDKACMLLSRRPRSFAPTSCVGQKSHTRHKRSLAGMQMYVWEHNYFFLCTVGSLFFWERRWRVTWCMNESCHTWMSHVTLPWYVMSHVNVSCHMWMGQVTRKWGMSHVNETCDRWICEVIRMSHVTHK